MSIAGLLVTQVTSSLNASLKVNQNPTARSMLPLGIAIDQVEYVLKRRQWGRGKRERERERERARDKEGKI